MELTNKQAADALRAMAAAREFYVDITDGDELDENGILIDYFMRSALIKGAEALETEEGGRQ